MSGSLSGLAQLLMPLLAGTGGSSQSQSGGTSTTVTNASSTSTKALSDILAQATANGSDTSKLQDIISNLFTQAGQNFLPEIAQANASGLYNTTSLGLAATKAKGEATNLAAKTVLDYQTQQQQMAQSAATNLASATKTAITTTPQTTTTSTGQKAIIPPQITQLLGAGLLGHQLWKSGLVPGTQSLKDMLLDPTKGEFSEASQAAWEANPVLPPDFVSYPDAMGGAGATAVGQSSAGDFILPDYDGGGTVDFLSNGATSSDAFPADTAVSQGASDLVDNFSNFADNAGSTVSDAASSVGSGIGDAASSIADGASDFFDAITSWF